jgi:hypothetical protein
VIIELSIAASDAQQIFSAACKGCALIAAKDNNGLTCALWRAGASGFKFKSQAGGTFYFSVTLERMLQSTVTSPIDPTQVLEIGLSPNQVRPGERCRFPSVQVV